MQRCYTSEFLFLETADVARVYDTITSDIRFIGNPHFTVLEEIYEPDQFWISCGNQASRNCRVSFNPRQVTKELIYKKCTDFQAV